MRAEIPVLLASQAFGSQYVTKKGKPEISDYGTPVDAVDNLNGRRLWRSYTTDSGARGQKADAIDHIDCNARPSRVSYSNGHVSEEAAAAQLREHPLRDCGCARNVEA
jgi:hypothetical protein